MKFTPSPSIWIISAGPRCAASVALPAALGTNLPSRA
jgi:hypothetical protein